jgi:hypothetical protein
MTFFVGNLVEVEKEHRTGRRDSDGGRAYILAINNDPNGRGTKRPQYDVKYVVGGIVSPNVKRRRISPVIMETTARRRLGDIGNRPSLLSPHHTPKKKQRQPQTMTPYDESGFATESRWKQCHDGSATTTNGHVFTRPTTRIGEKRFPEKPRRERRTTTTTRNGPVGFPEKPGWQQHHDGPTNGTTATAPWNGPGGIAT